MKKLSQIGLRILGLGLAVFVLTQIQYRDRLEWPDGRVETGTILRSEGDVLRFRPVGSSEIMAVERGAAGRPKAARGVIHIVRDADQGILLWAVLVFGPLTLVSIFRWWLLLRAIKIPIPFREALRLSYIGFFFNAAVPGLTGGDVVKAFYIARGSPVPYRAFLSVFVDRAIGLFGLATLAGIVIVVHLGQPEFRQAAFIVYGALLVALVLAGLLFSRRLKRWLRIEALLARLPFGQVLSKIEQAIAIYRDAPRQVAVAIGLSVLNHVGSVALVILIARALGIPNPWSHFFVIAPVCLILASIPLVPGGWGLREGAFAYFFASVGISVESSVATSVLFGLAQLCWYMVGGPVFMLRPDRASRTEIKAFSDEMQRATAGDEAPPARAGS